MTKELLEQINEFRRILKLSSASPSDVSSIFDLYRKWINPNATQTCSNCPDQIRVFYAKVHEAYFERYHHLWEEWVANGKKMEEDEKIKTMIEEHQKIELEIKNQTIKERAFKEEKQQIPEPEQKPVIEETVQTKTSAPKPKVNEYPKFDADEFYLKQKAINKKWRKNELIFADETIFNTVKELAYKKYKEVIWLKNGKIKRNNIPKKRKSGKQTSKHK